MQIGGFAEQGQLPGGIVGKARFGREQTGEGTRCLVGAIERDETLAD
jgi:hypothetical protein